MKPLFEDTAPKVEALLVKRLRQMSAVDKAQQLVSLNRACQTLALSRIRRTYPDATEREQLLRLASLWLDCETMRRVFDWDPVVNGY